jgi:phosphoglycolate phosphatase-like HAD superfamily hydrolase
MKIILFDIDGTLINSAGAGRRAMERGFADLYGIEDALDGVQLHGRADPAIIRDAFDRRLGRSPGTGEIDEIIDKMLAHLRTELRNSPGYRVLPGVHEILRHLSERDDVVLGLETGNTEPGAELKLSHGGIWHYFRFGGYGSDSDVRSEIVRAGIKRAEQLLGADDPIEEIWVVGDTPTDIEAGQAVGAKTLATATGMHGLDLLRACEPDLAVSDLSDVPLVIAALLGKT